MKALLKGLFFIILFFLIIGVCFGVYVLHAPPVAQPEEPKLQVHTRTSVRGRPTVNSKPVAYTKNVSLFSIEQIYLSNLSLGVFSKELVFSVHLGQRARYSEELLDKELKTVLNWQKMFDDSKAGVRLNSSSTTVKVLLSGKDWLLTENSTGAGYTVERNGDQLDIYLPNLEDVFNINKLTLSPDMKFFAEKAGKLWLIEDKKFQQAYEIRNDAKKLNVFQQSKYPIQTLLFSVDLASKDTLNERVFSTELREGFKGKEIPLSRNAKLIAIEDSVSWRVTDGAQKYNIRNEKGALNVYLALESEWLLIRINNKIKGWVQSERGTVSIPPPPTLTSRQQYREKLLGFMERLKAKVGISDKPDEPQNSELSQ